jgi:hypothetical protein
MIPSTAISKTDGNLGVATNTDRILAIIGTAASGPLNTGTSLTNKTDLYATFGRYGSLVQACAYMIARGIQVVAFRGSPTTAGAYGTVDSTGKTGTATVTASGTPGGRYDVIVKIVTGGTLGTTGITFIYSLDNGVNWSQETALGTGTTMTLDSGVAFTLATTGVGTLVANDTWSVKTTEPKLLTGDLTTSFAALTDYSGEWLRALVLADADGTILAQCDSFAKSFWSQGKNPEVIANTRPRNLASAESRSTYQGVLATISAAVQSTEVSCCADQCEIVSEVDGRRLRLPPAIPYAARLMTNDDSRDAAAKADGALTGVFLMTADGARNYHDESRYPGLDALGFTTLRTWNGRPVTPGSYVNNPRILAGPTSDYQFFQHSALLNRAIEKAFGLLSMRLSDGVLVDSTTGKIKESVAKAMEEAITADLEAEFSKPGRCSGIKFILARYDNVLTTSTLHFDVQMQPLAYTKQFIGKAGLVRVLPTT